MNTKFQKHRYDNKNLGTKNKLFTEKLRASIFCDFLTKKCTDSKL